MAEWNLSVDLRGQGTSLVRALRESARHARTLDIRATAARNSVRSLGQASQTAAGQVTRLGSASSTAQRNLLRLGRQARTTARQLRDIADAADRADARLRALGSDVSIRVRLDNDTAAGAAAVRASVARLRRLSPITLDVRFDADAANAAAALAAVRAAAQRTSITLGTLRDRARAAAAAMDDLATSAITAATGVLTLAAATRISSGHLRSMSGDVRTLRADLDGLNGAITTINGNLGGLTRSTGSASAGTKNLMLGAVGLASALIPIAAAAVPIAAGLAAAGAAAGAFGVAIGGQIAAMMEAGEAQEKYDEAVREHGKTSPEAAEAEKEYLRQIEKMPAATREAAAAVSVLKDEYKEWSNELASDTMPVAVKSMGLMRATLPKLTPLVKGASAEFEHMMDVLGGSMQTAGFDRFMRAFTEFAVSSLAKGTAGIVRFTQALDSGEMGAGLRKFLDYARANAPLVADTLKELAGAAMNLLVAFSDVGVGVLQIINVFAKLANALLDAIPPGALTAFLQVAAAMKLVTLSAAALGAVTGGAAAARLAAYFAVMRAAGVGATLRATAASMSGVSKAALGLGVLAVGAIALDKFAEKARGAPPNIDRLATSLKNLADTGEFTGELRKTFGDLDGLVAKVETLTKKSKDLAEAREGGATGLGRVPILDDIGDWISDKSMDIQKGEESLTSLSEQFKAVDQTMAGLASGGHGKKAAADFAIISGALRAAGKSTAEINALFPEYRAAAAALAADQKLAAEGMGLFGAQALATGEKLAAQKASADGLRASIQALNDINRQALGGQIGFEASIDAAAKAAAENAGALDMVNGKLDLNSPKAQAAATALQDLAAKTDEATASARTAGAPWEEINATYTRGRSELVKYAQQMGLTETEANTLADSILDIPDETTTTVQMRSEDAIAGLDGVIAKIEATPGSKSVTVSALTETAKQMLTSLGYKVERMPDGTVRITALTGSAISGLASVKAARDALSDKTIVITTHYRVTGNTARRQGAHGAQLANADGSVTDYYADGGIQRGGIRYFADGGENHVAQIAPAGAMRMWAEPETGGEAYVPLSPAKRPRSRAIVEETVRRLGGDPNQIQWNAAGGVTDWRYDPNTGSLYSASDAGQAGHKTRKVKVKGGKTKDVNYFDLPSVEKKLKSTAAATRAWNRDLEKVADRVGGDVAEALAAMGKDGVALTKKMANGSTKYINEMAAALRGLAATAKASLSDYTRSLNKATAMDATFASNLATLAGRGHGDLAAQLAAQGDQAAMELAAAAVKDDKKATSANTAAKNANKALTGEQVQQLVAIIAAIKTSNTGLHDVADTTGLGEDDIVAVASAATGQIRNALGSRAKRFIADLGRAQKGLSYENGGIRPGIYSTQAGAVTFAEPATGGEAFIPLGANKRRVANQVLADVHRRFGIGLTDISSSRQIVVVKEGGDTNVTVTAVRTGASATDIGFQVGRSVRRVRRGGVNARA